MSHSAALSSRIAGYALLAGLAVLLVLRLVCVSSHISELRPIGGGDSAPDFRLPLLAGGEFHLDEPGHVTVLDFWATWCGPCRQELPNVDELYRRVRDRGVRVVAVDIEGEAMLPAVREIVAGQGLKLPIALRGEEAANAYRVNSLPHLVIVDGAGRIRKVLMGVHGVDALLEAVEAASR